MNTTPHTTMLRQLDAGAAHAGDTAMHQRIGARLHLDHDAAPPRGTTPATHGRSRRLRLRHGTVVLAAAAAAVAGLAVVIIERPAPAMAAITPEAVATWTATTQPAGDTTAERNSCLREFGDGIADNPQAAYLLEERRGELTSMIASYRNQTAFCIIGPDNTLLLNSMSHLNPDVDVLDVPDTGVSAAVSGDDLDGPPAGRLHYITGRYAPDVKSIDLVLTDGDQVTAAMQDGFFTAWWNGEAPTPATQVTWTTTDGASTTSAYQALPY